MNRQFVEVDIGSITVKSRLRNDPGDLATLVDSVRRLGLIAPVVLDRNNVLIAGARRLEACRLAGLREIPALRLDVEHGSMTALDVQSDENLCRQALSQAELDRHIQAKKSLATGQSGGGRRGLFASLKRMF